MVFGVARKTLPVLIWYYKRIRWPEQRGSGRLPALAVSLAVIAIYNGSGLGDRIDSLSPALQESRANWNCHTASIIKITRFWHESLVFCLLSVRNYCK